MSRTARTLPAPSGPIALEEADDGVRVIRAGSRDDALRGLGYCHARDRGLQMLFVRIIGRGTASEWLAPTDAMLAVDRYFRRLDFLGDVEAEFAALDDPTRAAVLAYNAGINAFFDESGVPWELRLLGYAKKGFAPWTFADTVVTGKTIGYVSLGSTQGEIERWIIDCLRQDVPISALEEMFPGAFGGADLAMIRGLKAVEPVVPAELFSVAGLPWAAASNSWVVGGSRTASGLPILCNDPHLEINRIPPVWYEAALHWPDASGRHRYALGATMPGAPGVVLGRNADASWGVTYSYMDCIDSWVEDCRDGMRRRGDAWEPLKVREETIARKGLDPVACRFYDTPDHGTILGDPAEPGLYLATRWSCGTGTASGTVNALIGLLEAPDAEAARGLLAGFGNSAWNFVVADREGSIGMQMAGLMPLRPEGVSGLLPMPGWDPAFDWRGFADPADLPRLMNPPSGLIVAANDDLNPHGVLKPITLAVNPYRAERIRRVLEGADRPIDAEFMLRLQLDLKSTQAERFLAVARPILDEFRDDPGARTLREWDFDYGGESLGATLFERFYAHLYDEVFGRRLGPKALAHLRDETILIVEYYYLFDRILLSERSSWFGGRTRAQVYRQALRAAFAESAVPHRPSSPVVFAHILLGGKLPRFVGLDRGPFELRGGRATVSQCQVGRVAGREVVGGPSIRLTADMATDEIRTSLPGGPSDRWPSPRYGRGIQDYLDGGAKTIRGIP